MRIAADADPDSVEALESVTFESNSHRLTPASAGTLDDGVRRVSDARAGTVRIPSHAAIDGAANYNLEFSVRRAKSAEDHLGLAGIREDRLSSEGLGETQPSAECATAEGRALNRRVELVRTPERYR